MRHENVCDVVTRRAMKHHQLIYWVVISVLLLTNSRSKAIGRVSSHGFRTAVQLHRVPFRVSQPQKEYHSYAHNDVVKPFAKNSKTYSNLHTKRAGRFEIGVSRNHGRTPAHINTHHNISNTKSDKNLHANGSLKIRLAGYSEPLGISQQGLPHFGGVLEPTLELEFPEYPPIGAASIGRKNSSSFGSLPQNSLPKNVTMSSSIFKTFPSSIRNNLGLNHNDIHRNQSRNNPLFAYNHSSSGNYSRNINSQNTRQSIDLSPLIELIKGQQGTAHRSYRQHISEPSRTDTKIILNTGHLKDLNPFVELQKGQQATAHQSYSQHTEPPKTDTIIVPNTGQSADLNPLIKLILSQAATAHQSSNQHISQSSQTATRPVQYSGTKTQLLDPLKSFDSGSARRYPKEIFIDRLYVISPRRNNSGVPSISSHNPLPTADLHASTVEPYKRANLLRAISDLLLSPISSLDHLGNPALMNSANLSEMTTTISTTPTTKRTRISTIPFLRIVSGFIALPCGVKEANALRQRNHLLNGMLCVCKRCYECESRSPTSTSPSDVECGSKLNTQLCCCCEVP